MENGINPNPNHEHVKHINGTKQLLCVYSFGHLSTKLMPACKNVYKTYLPI